MEPKGKNEMPLIFDEKELGKAVETIRSGGVVLVPTDTCYGLAAGIFSEEGVRRIFDMKKRSRGKPIISVIGDVSDVSSLASRIPRSFRILADAFWPGPLTLILPAGEGVPGSITGNTGTVAVRMPGLTVLVELVREAGIPVTSTSANISGNPPPYSVKEVDVKILNRCDYALDGGGLERVPPSTVVDLTGDVPLLVRRGAIKTGKLREFISIEQ